MPPPPEIRDGPGHIRVVEIFGKMEAEHPAQADGHIGIAGEIKIDLQRIGDGTQPGGCHGKPRQEVEAVVGDLGHVVGKQELLAQAVDEPLHTGADIGEAFLPGDDLLLHLLIPDNGSGDELGEQGYVQAHIEGIFLPVCLAIVNIEQIAHQLEGEEGNADGKGDADKGKIPVQQQPQLGGTEGQVFENKQDHHMVDSPRHQHLLPGTVADQQTAEPGDEDGKDHQKYKHRFPPAIKQQAAEEQKAVAEAPAFENRIIVDHQYHRQE